jgi:hypothetical protein
MLAEMEVKESTIRIAVFDFLRRYNDLGEISIKDVRTHVAKELSISTDYFKGERKEALFNIITLFRASGGKLRKFSKDDEYKSGKFSKAESDLMLRVGQDYTIERHLKIQDLVSHMNVDGGEEGEAKAKRHLDLWRDLRQLLPNRKIAVSRTP